MKFKGYRPLSVVRCGSDTIGGVIEVGDGTNSQPGQVLSGCTLAAENLGVTDSPLSRYVGLRQSIVKVFFP